MLTTLIQRERSPNRGTLDILHYEVSRTDVVEGANIWILQGRDGPRFLLKRALNCSNETLTATMRSSRVSRAL
jgi:hypothetical protein